MCLESDINVKKFWKTDFFVRYFQLIPLHAALSI